MSCMNLSVMCANGFKSAVKLYKNTAIKIKSADRVERCQKRRVSEDVDFDP